MGPFKAQQLTGKRDEYSESVKYGNKIKGGFGQYDATLAYNLNDITTFTLQAINLTDAEQNWNYDGDEDMVYQDHQYGRRIMLGVTVKLYY
nr:TonB-dependent receptor [Colwellia piezophila]